MFLKGTLKGRLTIAADNNIDVIGNVTYSTGTGGSDLLGLVANNYVEIYHPIDDDGSAAASTDRDGNSVNGYYNLDLPGATTAFHNPTIQAAILSVTHSFRVQNYKYGEDNLGVDHDQRGHRAEVPRASSGRSTRLDTGRTTTTTHD